jgi:hypothetical protein
MTIDRQMVGDFALAVLIALPMAAFARPDPLMPQAKTAAAPVVQTAVVAQLAPVTQRSSLLG